MKIPDFAKQNSKFLITIVILTGVPFIFYFANFHGFLSNDHTKWGTFGDFIGGFLNTILTFILILFTTWSYYESQKMAQKIHEETKDLQKLVHEESLKFQQNQFKPLPRALKIVNTSEEKLILKNHGLGPLIIKNIVFKKEGKNFMLNDQIKEIIKDLGSIFHYHRNFGHIIVNPNSDEPIYEIFYNKVDESRRHLIEQKRKEMREIISDYTIEITFTDIFDNSYPVLTIKYN